MNGWALVALCLAPVLGRAQDVPDPPGPRPTDTLHGAYVPSPKPHLFIASSFGSDAIVRSGSLDTVSGYLITHIVLVYSQYHKSESFSQARLNNSRWRNLNQAYPSLFSNSLTKYADVCQTGRFTDSVARKLKHGFYIYYEQRPDTHARSMEIQAIDALVHSLHATAGPAPPVGKKAPAASLASHECRRPCYGRGSVDLDSFFIGAVELNALQKLRPTELKAEIHLRLDESGMIRSAHILCSNKNFTRQLQTAMIRMNRWYPAVRQGIAIKCEVVFHVSGREDERVHLTSRLIVPALVAGCPEGPLKLPADSNAATALPHFPELPQVEDARLLENFFARHKDLDSLMIVMDVTASMGPYIRQVLSLVTDFARKGKPVVSCLVLFNDGNGKSDLRKVIGHTGGVEVIQPVTVDAIGKAVIACMRKGNGGDCMENNVEALIEGLRKVKRCSNVIMIADNMATPRDLSLISSVSRPVHWVLCGAGAGINTNYLDLARSNHGSVHLLSADVTKLDKVLEAEVVQIDGERYVLRQNHFRPVR